MKERDRRWHVLRAMMRNEGLDALILASTDHRGHKGAVRYACDYGLYYRFGFALMTHTVDPVLVLPENFRDGARSPWEVEHRFTVHPAGELAALLQGFAGATLGVVGLRDAMRADDYRALATALPDVRLVDAGPAFDRVRSHKSADEMVGLAESAAIADSCFERLLDVARPGVSERALMGEMLAECARLGGDDTLFLTMGTTLDAEGPRAFMGAPRDLLLTEDQPLTFSLELTGPMGYWTEFCRSVVFGRAADDFAAADAACSLGLEAALQAARPGVALHDVYGAAVAAIDRDRYRIGASIGHSIGLDVVERPMIAAGSSPAPEADLAHDMMALAIHPRIQGRAALVHAYVADTVVIHDGPARRLSRWPLQLFDRPSVFSSTSARPIA